MLMAKGPWLWIYSMWVWGGRLCSTTLLTDRDWYVLFSCARPSFYLPIHPSHYPLHWVQGDKKLGLHEVLHTLLSLHVFRHLIFHLHLPSIHLPLLTGWATKSVYSIEVKMVTRAEGHGGTPHPVELTSPGWFLTVPETTKTTPKATSAQCIQCKQWVECVYCRHCMKLM